MDQKITIDWDRIVEALSDPVVGGTVAGLAALYTLGFCALFGRAGFHWSLGLLMLVPAVNVPLFAVLAFLPWPKGRELRKLRKLETGVARVKERYQRAA